MEGLHGLPQPAAHLDHVDDLPDRGGQDLRIGGEPNQLVNQVLPLLRIVQRPGRGSTVATIGFTSLLLALLGATMSQGAWGACVNMPRLGALAAEIGVPLDSPEDGGFAES